MATKPQPKREVARTRAAIRGHGFAGVYDPMPTWPQCSYPPPQVCRHMHIEARRSNQLGRPSNFLTLDATPDAAVILVARGLRSFADGFISVILPAYLTVLGLDA